MASKYSKSHIHRDRYLEIRNALLEQKRPFWLEDAQRFCHAENGIDKDILTDTLNDLVEQRLIKTIFEEGKAPVYFSVRGVQG